MPEQPVEVVGTDIERAAPTSMISLLVGTFEMAVHEQLSVTVGNIAISMKNKANLAALVVLPDS